MAGYVDVEDLTIHWIKTVLGYANVTDEMPINLVDLIRTNPVHVVERIGGADATITLDVARINIDTYASTRAAAKLHAETIRAALRTRFVRYIHNGASVGRVETISAPTLRPYDSRNLIRKAGQTVQVTFHQFSGVS